MKVKAFLYSVLLLIVVVGSAGPLAPAAAPPLPPRPHPPSALLADDPSPPANPVKLIFIHHSTGGNWLANPNEDQPYGGLGQALMNDNYFVSATNYEWGPDQIGSRTDIPNWPEWFTGPNSSTYLNALYTEYGKNDYADPGHPLHDSYYFGTYTRMADPDPTRQNEIIMFKSCFPNSDLYGNPDDPPASAPNDQFTVSNAKAVYNNLLTYFETRQDKLFIVITAPPLMESETAPERATNARAFNNWLVNDWLDGYPYNNVAVFDYYNVLTSNGSASRVDDPETTEEPNDAGWTDGNHHRWSGSAIEHTRTVNNNFSAYPSGDSHPSTAGHQKATAEFVPLLNIYYNRWRGGAVPGSYTFNAVISPTNATPPITYTWSSDHLISGQGTASATYRWDTDGVYHIALAATNCGGTFTDTHTVTVGTPLLGISTDNATAQQTMVFQDGVSPGASYAGTTDVILANDANDNANVGGAENLETFYGDVEYRRSLVRWDLSALPGGVTINDATMELYRYGGDAASSMQLALYRVTRDWTEGTGYDLWPDPSYVPDGATWLTFDGSTAWTTPGGDYDATIVGQTTLPAGMENGWVRLDATAAVRAWIEGSASNYGLLLRPQSGDYTYHYFHSRETVTPTLRPRLVVTYTTGPTPGPSLTLTAPNSSTRWPVSSTQQIKWNTNPPGSVSQVNLYYSSDGFITSDTIASGITNNNSYDWTTPPTSTTSARVRVESVVSPTTVYDVSDEFTLYATGTFTVYLPLAARNYVSCPYPLTGVSIHPATLRDLHANSGPSSGSTTVAAPASHWPWRAVPGRAEREMLSPLSTETKRTR